MKTNRQITASIITVVAIAGVLLQLGLTLQHAAVSVPTTLLRFFSYFTISTNLLVILYFGNLAVNNGLSKSFLNKAESAAAITTYIVVVGLIYQLILSKLYKPEGLNLLADNIIHGFTPVVTFIFWIVYESDKKVRMNTIGYWCLYPFLYLVYTLVKGAMTGFYPYPFVDVMKYGMQQVLINNFFIMLLFLLLFFSFGWIANFRSTSKLKA